MDIEGTDSLEQTPEPTLRDTIEKAVDESYSRGGIDDGKDSATIPSSDVTKPGPETPTPGARTRDEQGRFIKGTPQTPGDATSLTAQQPPARPTLEAPKNWKPEWKDAFSKAPPELQQVILSRDAQQATYISQLQNQMYQATQAYRQVEDAAAPYAYLLDEYGCNLPEAVDKLFWWQHQLEQDAPSTLVEMARSYGFEITGMQRVGGQSGPSGPEEPSARERQLEYQLRQQQEQRQADLDRQQVSQLQAELASWVNEKDPQGNPLRPYYEAFKPQIRTVVEMLENKFPQAAPKDLLQAAYEHVVEKMRSSLGNFGTPQLPPQQVVAQKTQAAKAAGSSLAPDSSDGAVPQGRSKMSIREIVERAINENS